MAMPITALLTVRHLQEKVSTERSFLKSTHSDGQSSLEEL